MIFTYIFTALLVLSTFSVIASIVVFKLLKYLLPRAERDQEGGWVLAFIVTILFGTIWVGVSVYGLRDATLRVIAPEWSTMQDISGLIRGNQQ